MKLLKLASIAALSIVLVWLVALIFLPLTYAQTDPPTPNNQTNVTPNSNQIGVDIMGFAFNPTPLTIPVGTTVLWTNKDGATHTVTSDTIGLFGSPDLNQSDTFSFKFDTVGTFGYHCNFHQSMMGTINVVNPIPTATKLYPNSATVGDPNLTLTIDGTNFISTSTVHWNNNVYTPTTITSVRLVVTIPAAEFTAQGTPQITVVNPAPGGGTSNPALTFTINLTCNPLAVTKKTDDGTCGTFRNALNGAGTSQINISLPPPSTIKILNTALTTPAGVHINGVCTANGPGIILDGTGIPGTGLTLSGGAIISGLKIKGFGGPQVQANPGGNGLSCVVISKT